MTRSFLDYADLTRLALQRRRLFLSLPLMAAAIFAAFSLVQPRTWTTSASFTPQKSAAGLGGLSGLASQFGVNVPVGDGKGPEFYSEVLRGDQILRRLLQSSFPLRNGASPVLLAAHLRPSIGDSARREALALRDLRRMVSSSVGLKSGIVHFSVSTDDPILTVGIAEKALSLLNQFNVDAQRNEATGEFAFSAERLALARNELRNAEEDLASFLSGNRALRLSPTLSLHEERLRREVGIRQQIMVALTQALEQARIEQARGTPVITIVEKPVVPGVPDSRFLLFKAVALSFVTGVILLVALATGEARRRARTRPDSRSAELEQLWEATAEDLRRPWRLFAPRTLRPGAK